jgi:hypothetical protein
MKVELTKKWSNKQLKITTSEVDLPEQAIKQLTFWEQLPNKCSECGSEDLRLNWQASEEFDFYNIKCNKCGADAKVGKKKDGKTNFIYQKFEKFVPKGDKNGSTTDEF